MKKILLIIASITLAFSLSGQSDSTEIQLRDEATYYHLPGSHSFSLGVGFPNKAALAVEIINLSGVDLGAKGSVQPTFKYEYAATEELGAGIHMGWYTAETGDIPFTVNLDGINLACCLDDPFGDCCLGNLVEEKTARYKINAFSVAGRLAYHRYVLKKVDIFGAGVAGYSFVTYKNLKDVNDDFKQVNAPTFVYYTSVGFRYFVTPEWAFYGEMGYGSITLFNAGATYRIIPAKRK